MEMSIFERDGETWTRFKFKVRELKIYAPIIGKFVDIDKPAKKNSIYIYYECKGDLLNPRKEGKL